MDAPEYDVRAGDGTAAADVALAQLYRAIVETAAEGVWTIDASGNTTFVNQTMADMLGYERHEMVGQHLFAFIYAPGRARAQRNMARCASGVREVHEVRLTHRTGRDVWATIATSPLHTPSGDYVGALAMVTDMTQRRAQRARQRLMEATLERSPDPVFWIGHDGDVVYVNNATCVHLGYSRAELLGLHISAFVPRLVAGDWPTTRARMSAAGSSTFESVHRRKDGLDVEVEVVAVAVEHDGQPFYCAFVREIAARKRAEEEARRQQEELARADKLISLGTLVAATAHEVNNPNHAIMLSGHVARDIWQGAKPVLDAHYRVHPGETLASMPYEEVREEMDHLLNVTIESSERIRYIVSQLREFAGGRTALQLEPTDINGVVDRALSLISPKIHGATDAFSVTYDADLPPISADPIAVEQVVINLVLNACQALDEPSEPISVETRASPEGGAVEVVVADAGRGIAPDDLVRITEPFFTTHMDEGGTGLGLAVSARITRFHEGRLEFDSAVGGGTTVRLVLPIKQGQGA